MPPIDESAETVVDRKAAKTSLRRQFAVEQDQIYSAIGYVVMAGMAFPGIALLIYFAMNARAYGFSLDRLAVATVLFGMVSIAGAALGFMFSSIFGVLFAVLITFFHYTTRCRFHPRTLVHFLGGTAGFWTVVISLSSAIVVRTADWKLVSFAAVLGMVLGQIATTVGYRRKYGEYSRQGEHLQFGILDMFVMVTWAAAIVAFFQWFPIAVMKRAGVWMAIQIPLLLISDACDRNYLRSAFSTARKTTARKKAHPQKPKLTRTVSVRVIFLLLTAVGGVCAIEPLIGLAIFAFAPAIFGLVLIRNGVTEKNDALSHKGVACVAFGFVAGALFLAGFAHLAGQ